MFTKCCKEGPFCYLCFMVVFVMLSCLFHAALWSPAGKGLTSWLSGVLHFLVNMSLYHMVSRVISVVLAWINYLSLLSSILVLYLQLSER